ncbi:MAG: hypothetical protein V4543_17910 [Bacteroidota bacterium]
MAINSILGQSATIPTDVLQPESLTPYEMWHHTRLYGNFNNRAFNLYGSGSGKPYEGFLDTELKSTEGLVHFPMTLLSPIALMGYPTYSTYQNGATDLFKISDGYSYIRRFSFDNGGYMNSEHRIKRENGHLEGEFEVLDAQIDFTGVTDLEPSCIESFYPAGPGCIQSFFRMRWIKADGTFLCANVNSEYRLNHTLELPYVHFRMIKFNTDHNQSTLKQSETLSVFYDIDEVNRLIMEDKK